MRGISRKKNKGREELEYHHGNIKVDENKGFKEVLKKKKKSKGLKTKKIMSMKEEEASQIGGEGVLLNKKVKENGLRGTLGKVREEGKIRGENPPAGGPNSCEGMNRTLGGETSRQVRIRNDTKGRTAE